MARIGLRFPVAAPIVSENRGETPKYGDGFIVGKAVSAEKSITTNSNPLCGDDAIAENDTSFASGTLTLGITDFGTAKNSNLEVQAKMLGHRIVTINGAEVLRKSGGDEAPYLGFGYYKTKQINGEKFCEATWLYKTQFQEPSESANTKGQTIEWQTPTITGNIMLVEGMDRDTWEDTAIFPTSDQAESWLKHLANIENNVDKSTLNATIASAESEAAETYTSESYALMYVALLAAQATAANEYSGQADVDSANTALQNAISALKTRS